MKRLQRHVIIPLLLAIYLLVMAILGIDGLRSGATSPMQYAATIVITVGILILLYFFLKKRDRLRRERLDDIQRNKQNK